MLEIFIGIFPFIFAGAIVLGIGLGIVKLVKVFKSPEDEK